MKRLLTQQLIDWKQQITRKPLLLDGARQVGKSYLIESLFGQNHFSKIHTLDFLSDPSLNELFDDGLDPSVVISNIEVRLNVSIDIEYDLIFFDEIGECQAAVNALKYFAEKMPKAFICASGSNIGLLDSFPVGKVQMLELFPFSFEEFLMASGREPLLKLFREQSRRKSVHEQLWKILLDYYFVGGMPEAVVAWYEEGESGVVERSQKVKHIHRDLIIGYRRDLGKYSGKVNAQHIESVFDSVPRQLAKNVDDSVKRFVFKDGVEKKQRYSELRGPIDWLEKAKLVSKCYPIDSEPKAPLPVCIKPNIFKLFLFDVGLLGFLLEMEYTDQLAQKLSYKGYIAENFVQNELRATIGYPTYSWETARAEIEFIHKCKDGEIIPAEVKSGNRTRARSLRSYVERYSPSKTVKLIGSVGSNNQETTNVVWPLYYAQFLREI